MYQPNIQTFQIKKSVYEDMIVYCKRALPFEVCGLLSGGNETGNTLWKIKNEHPSPNRFYMSKEAIKDVAGEINGKGEKLTGIFHSHPTTSAIPSTYDIQCNSYEQLAYLIVSFYKGKIEVGCFKIINKKVFPIQLIVTDE